jgi:hypothetical protein
MIQGLNILNMIEMKDEGQKAKGKRQKAKEY